MNSMKVKDKLKNIAVKKNIEFNTLLRLYMYDRFIERLAVSKYRDNFILKGGLLLSAMFGIESRSTRDMDISIKGIDVSKEKMLNVLNEILSIDVNDKVKFKVVDISDIREDDEYGGNKYHLVGKLENLKVILEREQPIDLLIHLGDAEGDEDSIAEMAGCRLEIVAGNNDFFSNLPREKELRIGSYRVLITHGHYYYVSAGIADIEREAAAQGYDIVMFGHTHRPVIDYTRDVIALNPGSLSYPRQEGRRPSYIVMDLDKNGKANFEIKYLKVLDELKSEDTNKYLLEVKDSSIEVVLMKHDYGNSICISTQIGCNMACAFYFKTDSCYRRHVGNDSSD